MQITKNQLSSYTIGKTIGRGTFGKVKLAMHKITGEPVAIKILEKDKIKDVTDVERVSRELHILKITQHASIAQMYEIIQNDSTIFIIMEYAPFGQFFDYIMDGKILNERESRNYFMQIINTIEYLHSLNISHRDIKPQNMLLDSYCRLKIVDFGLSNMFKKGQKLLTACGSPCYASPEMIKGEQYDPELTDVWSLGVVLFAMSMAKLPFQDDNTSVLYSKIKAGNYIIDKKISPQLRDLISKMLCVKPADRISIQKIKNHPWLQKQKIPKLIGLKIGFQILSLDEQILQQMSKLGFDTIKARKYLQNNIKNDITATYFLLMKRKFRNGTPSKFDINNESFDQRFIGSNKNLNTVKPKKNYRHKSFDACIKDFQRLDDHSTGRVQRVKSSKKLFRMQRKCHSQLKSYQIQKKSEKKDLYNSSKKKFNIYTPKLGDSLNKSKKSLNSIKVIGKKNPSKQQNISINVYINNAKIQTSMSRDSKKKFRQKNVNISHGLQDLTSIPSYSHIKRRLKTQADDDKRYDRRLKKSTDYQRSLKTHDRQQFFSRSKNKQKDRIDQSKSLQKSNNLDFHETGTFWKKRSGKNNREYTSQTRERSRYDQFYEK